MRILLLLLMCLAVFAEDRFILRDPCWNTKWEEENKIYRTSAYVDEDCLYYLTAVSWMEGNEKKLRVDTICIPAVSITEMTWVLQENNIIGTCKINNWVLIGSGFSDDGQTAVMTEVNKVVTYVKSYGSPQQATEIKQGIETFIADFKVGKLSERILGKVIDLRKTTGNVNYPTFGLSYTWGHGGIESRSMGKADDGAVNFSRMFLINSFNTKFFPSVNCEVFNLSPTNIKSIGEPVCEGEYWSVFIKYSFCNYFVMDKKLDPGEPEFAERRRNGEIRLVFNTEADAIKSVEWIQQFTVQ